MLQWAGRAKCAHGTLRSQHAKANECQTGKRYCLWEIHSVPLDLPWSFNAVSLSLLSHSPTHLPLLIISSSLERQGRDGETDSTISDSISWLCTSCPWASPLPVALVPLMSACQKNEWYASGNNPVCKINLQEMGFLTCRLNIADYCVWLSLLLALSTCIFLTLSIITPHPQKTHICTLLNGKKVNFLQKMLWSPVPLRGLEIFKSLQASFWTIPRVTLFSCSLPTCSFLKSLAQVAVCHSRAHGNKLFFVVDFSDNYWLGFFFPFFSLSCWFYVPSVFPFGSCILLWGFINVKIVLMLDICSLLLLAIAVGPWESWARDP